MELYILSKQDLSILSICKLSDYQINLDEETNAKSTFTLMKTEGLKKDNFMVLNGLYRQFLFIIDDVQTEKGSDLVTITALDISNIFDRKVIEKNTDTMTSNSIEEFIANTMSENFVNSDDTALNVSYIDIYWETNTKGTVATNAENGLYNFHTFLINCRQYKNIYTNFKIENIGEPQIIKGKNIKVDAKARKGTISLHGETIQNGTPTPETPIQIENVEGKNKFDYSKAVDVNNTIISTYRLFEISGLEPNTQYTFSGYDITSTTTAYIYLWNSSDYSTSSKALISSPSSFNPASSVTLISGENGSIYLAMHATTEDIWNEFIQRFEKAQLEKGITKTKYVPYNSIEVKVTGKNRLNIADVEEGRLDSGVLGYATNTTELIKNNDSFSFTTNARYRGVASGAIPVIEGQTIVYNQVEEITNDLALMGTFYNKEGLFLSVVNLWNKTTTVPTGAKNMRLCWLKTEIGTQTITNPQLEIGEVATEYERHKSQTVCFPLEEGQKLMQGSYLADDGIHNVRGQKIFNGTESYILSGGKVNSVYRYNVNINTIMTGLKKVISSHYNQTDISQFKYIDEECIASHPTNQQIAFFTNFATIEEFKTYLAGQYVNGTPLIIEYELIEEEIVPYTEEQQNAYNKLQNLILFDGINYINSNANIILNYYPQKPVGVKFILSINIQNKEESEVLIDTTLPEVTDYNKIYEEDVTAKVQVYIREEGSEYNLYLKTDRTTTTNKDDPDRANGKIEVISVDTADRALEEALNVMKGNNYKHLVEFKIAKTSKLMDITQLHIGRPIRIKTDDDIYDSYISAITLSDENFVYFKSGSMRNTLLDKLKKNKESIGNKVDVSGGKIIGDLDIEGTLKVDGKNILGTILYENETGTIGDITLNDNITNYKYIEIYGYRGNRGVYAKARSNVPYILLNHQRIVNDLLYSYVKEFAINDNILKVEYSRFIFGESASSDDAIYVTQVIGYK